MAVIDVLLPVRNGAAFLGQALDSLQAQTIRDWRILVLDHGSSDGSAELAEAYAERDRRIEVFRLGDAEGLAALLNAGLRRCDCRYMLRHDADDVAEPNRMARLLEVLQDAPDLLVLGSDGVHIDAKGRVVGRFETPHGRDRVRASIFFRNPIVHPAAILNFPKMMAFGACYGADFIRALPAAGQLHVSGLAEDYFLFGQLALLGPCDNIPDLLLRYRRHSGTVGATRYAEQMAMALAIARSLSATLSAMTGLPAFDPAPFSNHGDCMVEIDDASRLDEAFDSMAAVLRHSFGSSEGLERELAFREVLASRAPWTVARRYLGFMSRHVADRSERMTISATLRRRLRRRPLIRAPAYGLAS